MAKNLFVAGLSYDTSNDSLKNYFSEIGVVSSAQVIIDRTTNRSKGFGFVEMATDEEAAQAIERLNNTSLDGRTIVVKEAKPREDNRGGYNNNRSGGYNGGGSGGYRSGGGSYNRNNNNKRDNRNRY